jgi:1,4-dihydroxy-2-naphthoate octaprenyltransferase
MRFLLAARPAFFAASLAPVLVAGAYVRWSEGKVDVGLWILVAVAMVLLHAAGNLLNDYFDSQSGADELNTCYVSPFTGGGRAIQQGLVQAHEVLFVALGLYLAITQGAMIFLLGVFGGLSLFFYTAPPLRLGYRGLGEIIIGLDFGILPVLGTQYVLTHHFTLPMFVLSLPIALLIIGVLWVNQFPDADADALVGKRHLVVVWGRPASALVALIMYAATFLLTAIAVAMTWLPVVSLLSLAAALPAAQAVQALVLGPDDPAAWRKACPAGVMAHTVYSVVLFVTLLVAGHAGA